MLCCAKKMDASRRISVSGNGERLLLSRRLLLVLLVVVGPLGSALAAEEYNVLHRDGAYEFGYDTPDSYHRAQANRANIVRGDFGARSPKTGAIDTTVYTAGPRGYRPRGKNIARKYDLSQLRRGPIGSRDDPYFDPNEDPSYNFAFRTRTYDRQEAANSLGDVTGRYSYVDDVGERHNVEFIAGKNTGFHVKTPFPDSNPRAYGNLFFRGRGKPLPRGRHSIQRGLDGSYKFTAIGPDQRRTESSDSRGNVRGSYTYLDDKGVQHSVHYIAGPGIGYRVLKNVKGPHVPSYPLGGRPDTVPTDFYDYYDGVPDVPEDVFDAAASGHVKPPPLDNSIANGGGGGTQGGGGGGGGRPSYGSGESGGFDEDYDSGGGFGDKRPSARPDLGGGSTNRPARPGFGGTKPFGDGGGGGGGSLNKPSYEDDEDADVGDVFGDASGGSGSTTRPTGDGFASKPPKDSDYDDSSSYKPPEGAAGLDDGSYKPSGDDGTYKPDSGESGGSVYGGGGGSNQFSNTGGGSRGPGGTGSSGPFDGNRPGRPGGDYDSGEVNADFGLFDGGSAGGTGMKPPQRPSGGNANRRPGYGGSSRPGSRPGGGFGSRPGVSSSSTGSKRPGFSGSGGGTGGFGPGGGLGFGIAGGPSGGGGGWYDGEGGTIIRNLGTTHFSVPPGVSVRAHVQAIDLLPLGSRVPSPSEQFKADTQVQNEQLKEAASNNLVSGGGTIINRATAATTTTPNPTVASTIESDGTTSKASSNV